MFYLVVALGISKNIWTDEKKITGPQKFHYSKKSADHEKPMKKNFTKVFSKFAGKIDKRLQSLEMVCNEFNHNRFTGTAIKDVLEGFILKNMADLTNWPTIF